MPLYARLDLCDRSDNESLTDTLLDWLEDRMVGDDFMAALRCALPGVSEIDLLNLVGNMTYLVRQP
jgi:hypothetical protein